MSNEQYRRFQHLYDALEAVKRSIDGLIAQNDHLQDAVALRETELLEARTAIAMLRGDLDRERERRQKTHAKVE